MSWNGLVAWIGFVVVVAVLARMGASSTHEREQCHLQEMTAAGGMPAKRLLRRGDLVLADGKTRGAGACEDAYAGKYLENGANFGGKVHLAELKGVVLAEPDALRLPVRRELGERMNAGGMVNLYVGPIVKCRKVVVEQVSTHGSSPALLLRVNANSECAKALGDVSNVEAEPVQWDHVVGN